MAITGLNLTPAGTRAFVPIAGENHAHRIQWDSVCLENAHGPTNNPHKPVDTPDKMS